MHLPAAAAALSCSAVLLSCGGTQGSLSRTALVAQADAICLKVNRQAAAAVAALPRSSTGGARQAFIAAAQATLPLSDRGLAQLRKLRAPSSLASDWQSFVRDTQREDAGEHALVRAAQGGDLRRGEAIQVAMQAAAADLQRITARDGFLVCGRPQGR